MLLTEEEKKANKKKANKKYSEANKEKIKKYREANKEKVKESKKKWNNDNKETISQNKKIYYKENKETIVKKSRKWYNDNKEKVVQNKKRYFKENKEIINIKKRKWYNDNKEKAKEYARKYQKNNRVKISEKVNNKLKNDKLFSLSHNTRNLIKESIKNKGYTKKSRSFEILGCSFEDFKTHLENQFESWMNWENKGNPKDGKFESNKTWDIDHIIPLSSATSEEEIIKLNHYTNLRPLCSYYNRFVKRHHLEEDLKKDLVDNL